MPETNAIALTLLLGGVRAGKSARALQLAHARAGEANVLFVATAQAFDSEMKKRITAHRNERAAHWHTLEEPIHLAAAMQTHFHRHPATSVVIIDCMTLWVSNLMLANPDHDDIEQLVAEQTQQLLFAIHKLSTIESSAESKREWIVVSNEVGLGIVPPTPLGRQYRDALGRANQLMAAAASDVSLLVAGLEMPLKTRPNV